MDDVKPGRPAARLEDRDYRRLSQFRQRLRLFLRHSETLCRAAGLTPLQYQLLLHVRGAPEDLHLNIGELAERLQSHHHGVVALVDRCARLALIERRADPRDRRKVTIRLLPKGRALVEDLARQHQQELELLRVTFD